MKSKKARCLFSGIFLIFIYLQLNAQPIYNSSLFSNNGVYRYFVGSTEPDTNWYKPEFSDESWASGKKSIGFGDGDDTTQIDKSSSVFLRIHFNYDEKSAVKEANLFADFDDGYVAYLNGVEIVRVNLGKPGEYIPYNRLTDRSHEAVFYRNYERPVTGYYIDQDILSNTLKNGENILAVQVHNDSLDGSDLTFNSHLVKYNAELYNVWNDPFRFYAQIPLDSSRFPIIFINTDEYGFPLKKHRYDARMSVIYNPINEYNKPTDSVTDYNNGNISIEIRGNSTSDVPKNSYNIETQDSIGDNLNVSLLGMPADDDWVLYAPYADKSLIRNELAFYLGKVLGYYEPRTHYCELIFNGEYRGLYVLTEKIKRNSNRINVSQNSFVASGGIDVSGGYVLRFGDFDIYPKPADRTNAQNAYLDNFFNDINTSLGKHNLGDPEIGYRKYINEQYLIDYMLNNELMHNVDAYGSSTFLFKDRDDIDGKLKFGPVWDNDLSLGNTFYRNMPDDWMFAQNPCQINLQRILSDTVFVNNMANRWFELRSNVFSDNNLFHFIDSVSNSIKESRIKNYKVWPLLSAPLLWPSYIPPTYEFEIDTMKQWLAMHAAWIDNNIGKIHYNLPVSIPENELSQNNAGVNVYPVPFVDYINVQLDCDDEIDVIDIMDIGGRIIVSKKISNGNNGKCFVTGLDKLQSGLYMLLIKKLNGDIESRIIIKGS